MPGQLYKKYGIPGTHVWRTLHISARAIPENAEQKFHTHDEVVIRQNFAYVMVREVNS